MPLKYRQSLPPASAKKVPRQSLLLIGHSSQNGPSLCKCSVGRRYVPRRQPLGWSLLSSPVSSESCFCRCGSGHQSPSLSWSRSQFTPSHEQRPPQTSICDFITLIPIVIANEELPYTLRLPVLPAHQLTVTALCFASRIWRQSSWRLHSRAVEFSKIRQAAQHGDTADPVRRDNSRHEKGLQEEGVW